MDVQIQREAVNQKPRLRLEFLDGLRGLSALYVVLHHIYGEIAWSFDAVLASTVVMRWLGWLDWGHFAVVIFIVLSGYCLMLPIVRSEDEKLRQGSLVFFRRRALRIMPPYYAALVSTLALIKLVPGLQSIGERHVPWDSSLPAFTFPAVLSHILLVQNFSSNWIYKIDVAMWSVATEWQIYFLFPFFLLPIWRRYGNAATICTGFSVGIGLHLLSHHRLSLACPWFIGCFAVGMAAAAIGFAKKVNYRRLHALVPWGMSTALLVALIVIIYIFVPRLAVYGIGMDILVSLMVGCLLIYCADHAHATDSQLKGGEVASRPLIICCLECRVAVGLGTFSYSLYLVHYPVLGALHLFLRNLHFPPNICLLWLMLAGLPLSLVVAYIFHLIFERPFMSLSTAVRQPTEG